MAQTTFGKTPVLNEPTETIPPSTRAMLEQIVEANPELLRCPSCDCIIHEDGESRCPECAHKINWEQICKHAIEENREQFKYLWYANVAELPLDELRCLTCEYRLTGLTHQRCPECGNAFDWDTVCDAAISKRNNLFEYRWYTNPLSSLAKTTWLGAARPFKLWKSYGKSDTPRVGPLLFLIAIQYTIFARGWHAIARGVDPLMNYLKNQIPSTAGTRLRFTYAAHFTDADLIDYLVWSIATFLTLQLFVQSNRKYHANWRQVLRVFAHITLFASLCTTAWCILETALDSTLFFWSWPQKPGGVPKEYYTYLGNGVMYTALTSAWVSLWIGYSKYLRIPHGWAISGVAIFTGYLASQSLRVFILPF